MFFLYLKMFLEYLPIYQLIQLAVGRRIRSYESDHCAIVSTDYRLTQMGIWVDVINSNSINEIKQNLALFY